MTTDTYGRTTNYQGTTGSGLTRSPITRKWSGSISKTAMSVDSTTSTYVTHAMDDLEWRVQEKNVWIPYDWERVPIEVKTTSVLGSNDAINFEVAKSMDRNFARVVVRLSEPPIYYVQICQDDTPLKNLPPTTDDARIWKFIKHGFEGISIECNGVEVAHLKFAESPKPECQSSQWISSTVEFIKFNPDWDKTVAIRGTFFANVSFSF